MREERVNINRYEQEIITSKLSRTPLKELLFLPVICDMLDPAEAIDAPALPRVPPIIDGRCEWKALAININMIIGIILLFISI